MFSQRRGRWVAVKWTRLDDERGSLGDVVLYDVGGRLWLRWHYGGRRYQLGVGIANTGPGRRIARTLASKIRADIEHDREWPDAPPRFDSSLSRYKGGSLPSMRDTPAVTVSQLWEEFTESRRVAGIRGQTLVSRYAAVGAHLERGGNITTADDAHVFFKGLCSRRREKPLAHETLNRYRQMLKQFGRWAVEQGRWETNHFEGLPLVKGTAPQRERPFNKGHLYLCLTWAYRDTE